MSKKSKKKDTLNIYEVLELLNKKINSNNYNIDELKKDISKQNIRINEIKSYLLGELTNRINSVEESLFEDLDLYKDEINKELTKNQKLLISNSFKKLKSDINNDLEDLTDRIMNSKII
jgi:gas vesicle protein